jgi:putative cardiolipin synthase
MQPLSIFLVLLAGCFLASFPALYAFGRFRRGARPEPSYCLPVEDGGTALDDLIAPLAQERPGQSGLMLLADNLDAFAIRVLAARRAGRSLDLQYYMWRDDLTGRLLANELLRAADRGVRIRLLLDDINAQGYDRTYLALDSHPNIVVRLFNPSRNREGALQRGFESLLRAFSVTRRMHNKAWIADGRLAVVGGRNIGDAYFDAAEKSNFRDMDLLSLGEAVRGAEAVFDAFWNSLAVVPIAALGDVEADDLAKLRRSLEAATSDELAGPYLKRVAEDETVMELLAGDWRLHWTSDARILSDPPEKVRGKGEDSWLIGVIRALVTSATTDLEVISPYFIPGSRGAGEFTALAKRGVRVSVLTNSLAATDVTAVHGAYAGYRRALIEGGVNLFELKPYDRRSGASLFGSSSASLHTKAFTIDGRLGFVGSMNFDPRSLFLNSEMGVVFEQRELVEEIRGIFADETSPQKSYRLAVEAGRIVWRDLAAGQPRTRREEPEAGLWRRLAAATIGFLPIQSQL